MRQKTLMKELWDLQLTYIRQLDKPFKNTFDVYDEVLKQRATVAFEFTEEDGWKCIMYTPNPLKG